MRDLATRLLKAHVNELAVRFEVTLCWRTGKSEALREARQVCLMDVDSQAGYAVALHELGHVVGRNPRHRLAQEGMAWVWAREHALVWTPPMNRKMRLCLATYVCFAQRAKNVVVPPRTHPFWTLQGR